MIKRRVKSKLLMRLFFNHQVSDLKIIKALSKCLPSFGSEYSFEPFFLHLSFYGLWGLVCCMARASVSTGAQDWQTVVQNNKGTRAEMMVTGSLWAVFWWTYFPTSSRCRARIKSAYHHSARQLMWHKEELKLQPEPVPPFCL